MKRFLFAFVVVVIAAMAILGFQRLESRNRAGDDFQLSQSTSTPEPETVAKLESGVGYTIQLPANFESESVGTYSRLYKKKTIPGTPELTNFAYISVVPTSQATASGEIYNYAKADVQALRQLPLNDSIVLGAKNLSTASYFTYTHQTDTMIGGYGAKVFVNSKPWEFPTGTTEYRYLIEFGNVTYVFGGYVGTTDSAQLQKSELDQLFSTISFQPDSVQAMNSPIPTGIWKTYSNPQARLSLSYPSQWPLVEDTSQFRDGDLFSLIVRGETSRPQSELSDGIIFTVMKPQPITQDLRAWMEARYIAEPGGDQKEPEYSSVSFAGNVYQKVVVCGLGCFTYYHIVKDGSVYGFLVFAVGPNEANYLSTVSKILSSVSIL